MKVTVCYLFPFIFLVNTVNFALADAQTETAKKQAIETADAMKNGDYEKLVAMTYPKLVEMMGGHEKMVKTMKESVDQMKSQGIEVVSVDVEEPGKPVESKGVFYCIVPMTMKMKAPKASISQKSFLVGISTSQGATWTFLDGSVGSQLLATMLPDLPANLKLPEKGKPVIEEIK